MKELFSILRWYIFSTPKGRRARETAFAEQGERRLLECIEYAQSLVPPTAGADIYGPIAWGVYYERYM